ncbi:hypothetical protein BC629DRAFT_447139 [Irpex lacteus]|nr:hypothetical protein BC629DRAFT_447139 [Irpex lacteus]
MSLDDSAGVQAVGRPLILRLHAALRERVALVRYSWDLTCLYGVVKLVSISKMFSGASVEQSSREEDKSQSRRQVSGLSHFRRLLSPRPLMVIMQGAVGSLIYAANTCIVAPVIDGMLVPLHIEAIYIDRLRERAFHNSRGTFIEISVIGQDHTLVRTEVNSAPTAPRWHFKRAVAITVSPSSSIRFAVYRQHRILSDELIGTFEGSAWTFLDAHSRQGKGVLQNPDSSVLKHEPL